jgi:hypothetical protein
MVTKQKQTAPKTFIEWQKLAWEYLQKAKIATSAKDLYTAIPLPLSATPKHVSCWLKQKYLEGKLKKLQALPKEAHRYLIKDSQANTAPIHIKQAVVKKPEKQVQKSEKQKETEKNICDDIIIILDALAASIKDLKEQVESLKTKI